MTIKREITQTEIKAKDAGKKFKKNQQLGEIQVLIFHTFGFGLKEYYEVIKKYIPIPFNLNIENVFHV